MIKKLNPILGAFLSFLFGPIGYLYIGWKYSIVSFVMFGVFLLPLIFFNLDPALLSIKNDDVLIILLKLPFPVAFAWRAYLLCKTRNDAIDSNDRDCILLIKINSFAFVSAIMLELIFDFVLFYVVALGIYVSVSMFIDGHYIRGLLCIVGILPLVWIASMIVGIIIDPIKTKIAGAAGKAFVNRVRLS